MPLSYSAKVNVLDVLKPKFDANGAFERQAGNMVKEQLRSGRVCNILAEHFGQTDRCVNCRQPLQRQRRRVSIAWPSLAAMRVCAVPARPATF